MDSKKVGSFICSLRKEKLMTQKELSNKLNVTNKAVSKWETGEGYPEITTIPVLAEILGVTTSELLNGERSTQENNDADSAMTIIKETTKSYYDTSIKIRRIAIMTTAIISILSVFVCFLCNYLVNNIISWSLYVAGALIVAWSAAIPIIKINKLKEFIALSGFTITLIGYLFLIEYLSPAKGWVIPLALPITILSAVALGIILFMFIYTRIHRIYCIAISIFIFGVIVNICIGKIVNLFLGKAGLNNVSTFATALASIFIIIVLIMVKYIRRDY